MHFKTIILTAALATLASTASLDVSKGTDIIPPDSEEAHKLSKSDKAVKTAPKDNSYVDGMESEKFKKPEPKINNQNLDVPDTESLSSVKEVSVASKDDHPVVLNDYDPNNLGVPADKVSEKEGKDKKGKGKKVKDEKESVSGAANDGTTAKPNGNSNTAGSTSKSTTLTGTTGSDTGAITDGKPNANPNSKPPPKSDGKSSGNPSQGTIGSSPFHSFSMAGSMIIFSEIGDKTFLIAALMAMKHPRITVFTSAFASLVVMTILSALMGHALPALLPKKLTSILAAVLFIVFGVKLLREGLAMDVNLGVEEELEEVETEIEAKELSLRNDELESGTRKSSGSSDLRRSPSSPKVYDDGLEKGSSEIPFYSRSHSHSHHHRPVSAWKQFVEGVSNLASLVLSPVWVQVFVMTFLGEWGDRSQVATIAMAAGSDYWFVILGAILGHCICTMAAVVGGKLLATKISMRQITLAGAVSFLVFSIIYFYEGLSLKWSD